MFDLGWTELLIVVVVAVLVIGPKELPRALRSLGKWTSRARRMAGDFQRQFNEAIREADLEDVKDQVSSVKSSVGKIDPIGNLRSELTKVGTDIKKDLQKATKIDPPASEEAKPASPPATGVKPAVEAASASASSAVAKPEASKVEPARKTAAKKTASARKPTAKKTAAKKSTAKKPAAQKPAAGKTTAAKKTATAKKTTTRKSAATPKAPAARTAPQEPAPAAPAPAETKPTSVAAKPAEAAPARPAEDAVVAGDAKS